MAAAEEGEWEGEGDTQRRANDVFLHDRRILNERPFLFFFLLVLTDLSASPPPPPPPQPRVPALGGRLSDRSRGGGLQVHGHGVVADAVDRQ